MILHPSPRAESIQLGRGGDFKKIGASGGLATIESLTPLLRPCFPGYSQRFQNVPLMLSQSGFRSGSSIADRLTVSSSMAVGFVNHSLHSSS